MTAPGDLLRATRRFPYLTAVLLAAVAVGYGCWRELPPDTHNELPFGHIDVLRTGERVGRVVDVGGWALDDSSVKFVQLYVDGKYNAVADITIPRPDVSRAFPKYVRAGTANTDLHGWAVAVDLGEQPGPHVILA